MRRVLLLALVLACSSLGALPAAAGIQVSGRIELPDGGPAAGVVVDLVAQTSAYEYGLLFLDGRHYPEPVASARTTADGSYELTAPEAGMWQLYTAPKGYRPMELLFLPLLTDRVAPTLELTRETEVRVRLIGAEGEPLAGAHLRAQRPPRPRRSPSGSDTWRAAYRQAIADAGGVAVLQRGPDELLHLFAFAAGHLQTERTGVDSPSLELRLEPATPRTVRVQDTAGRPVPGAIVRLGERRWPAAASGDDGLVELPLPAEGEPGIQAMGPEGGRARDFLDLGSVPAGAPPTLTLLPPDRRAGRVVDAATRQAIPGAFAWIASHPADAVRTDSNGGFSLSSPGSGSSIWIWAAAQGYIKEFVQLDTATEPGTRSDGEGPVLVLQRALQARGVVVDQNDQPVADAAVMGKVDLVRARSRTSWQASKDLRPATSDASGRFLVGDFHPEVSYVLSASKPGFAPTERELPNPRNDMAGEIKLVLELGRMATGRVVGPANEPVVGALLRLEKAVRSGSMRTMMQARALGSEAVAEAHSDESGEFAFQDLPPGTFDLEASAPGYAPTRVPLIEIAREAADVDLGEVSLEPGAPVEGRVTDARGAAIEGAQVFASGARTQATFIRVAGAGQEPPDAVSDTNGFFSIPDRRPGEKLDLIVEKPGYAEGRVASVEAPTRQPISVRLQRASRLRGEVVDSTGRPVGDATVTVTIHMEVTMGSMSRSGGSARTDADGVFVIEEVDPGKIELIVQAEGYRHTQVSSLVVEPERDLEDIRVVLEPGATVSGRVTDATGRPVADAMVMLADSGRLYSGIQQSGITGADGRYRLNGIAPGPRSVTARHERYRAATREIEVELGNNVLDLVFEGGATVSGRVVDESGQPVVGAGVSLSTSEVLGWQAQSHLTDTTGAFSIVGVEPGTFTLTATKEGFGGGVVEELEVGVGDVSGIEIRLATGSAIVGRLLGLEPSDYASVQVMAMKVPSTVAMGRVDGEGGFRIEDLAPGEYRVQAHIGMGTRQAVLESVIVDPGGGETLVDLEFATGFTLSGTVLKGGDPATGIYVSAIGKDVASSSGGTTDSEGRFQLKGLQAGTHMVSVTRFGSGLNQVEEIDIQSDRDMLIRIESAEVSGRAVDALDSTPLSAAAVRLESLDPGSPLEPFRLHAEGATDSTGFFRFAEATAGAHRLVVQKDGYAPAELDVTVVDGFDQTGLELRLEPTEGVRIFVTLPTGQRAVEFFAAVLGADGRPILSGIYSGSSEGTRLSVPPGEWELLVSARQTAAASVLMTVPSEPLAIVLPEQASLAVRVPALEGDSTLATIRVKWPDGRPFRSLIWRSTREEWPMADGKGAVSGLGPGTWLIDVQTEDGRVWSGQATLGPGENPELVLQ